MHGGAEAACRRTQADLLVYDLDCIDSETWESLAGRSPEGGHQPNLPRLQQVWTLQSLASCLMWVISPIGWLPDSSFSQGFCGGRGAVRADCRALVWVAACGDRDCGLGAYCRGD